tara:strand:- start:340 stop:594 length:255 start_codon:yes stop_codon:yes gene_type:complete
VVYFIFLIGHITIDTGIAQITILGIIHLGTIIRGITQIIIIGTTIITLIITITIIIENLETLIVILVIEVECPPILHLTPQHLK